MAQVTLTIAEIRPPAEGKTRGNIIAADGRKFGCFREKFGLFQVGGTYDVEISDGQYQNVVSAKPIAAASPAAAPTQQAAPSAPAANGHGNGNGHYRQTDPVDSERMFVCATLTALIRAGEVKNDKSQLFHTTNMLRLLFQHTFGNGSTGSNTFTAAEAGRPRMMVAAE
jgi:hypothetical protein